MKAKKRYFSICGIVILSLPTVFLAKNLQLDEIVVSTTGFESTLKDEVRNVHVLGQKDLEKRGYRTLREAIEKIPGVDILSSSVGEKIDIRGQGDKANTAVKVMVNGVSMNMLDSAHGIVPIDMIAIEDVERIEVMPGGGSVLYGSGTRGGVINIITKKNPKDFFASIGAKIGSYKYRDFNFNVGGNASDNLFLKLGGKVYATDGYRDDFKERGYYLSGAINYQIGDDTTIAFTPTYYNGKLNTIDSLTLAQIMQDRRQNPYPGQSGDEKMSKLDLIMDFNTKFGDNFAFDFKPYFQKIKITNYNDIKTSPMYNAYESRGLFGDKKYGANTKGKYDYDSGEFILGYDFLYNQGDRASHIFYDVNAGRMTMNHAIDTVLDLKKTSHAFYFMEKHNFNDNFNLSIGSRFEHARYDVTRNAGQKMASSMPIPAMNYTKQDIHKQKNNQNNYAFEITPNYKYSDTGNVYAKFERGYISPSPSELTDKNPVTKQYSFNGLDSESFQTYEIGLKDEISGVYFSVSAFLTDTKDEIINEMLGGHGDGWMYYNLDKTRRYGGEISFKEYLFDKLSLNQNYSYVDTEIKKGKNKGKEVPLVSNHKFVFGANYEVIPNLNIFSDIKYYSKKKDSAYETIKAKTLVDIGFNYKFNNGLMLGAGVKNLFNKKYYEYESKRSDIYYPADERNYYAEFKFDF